MINFRNELTMLHYWNLIEFEKKIQTLIDQIKEEITKD